MIYFLADCFGLFFLALGVGYLYRPDLIAKVIAFIREKVLNDSHIVLERKKWGLFFLILSVLSFCLGIYPPR